MDAIPQNKSTTDFAPSCREGQSALAYDTCGIGRILIDPNFCYGCHFAVRPVRSFQSSSVPFQCGAPCRDVKNQVYSSKMNAKLKDLDPSSRATRIRGHAPVQALHVPMSQGSSPKDLSSPFQSSDCLQNAAYMLTDERMPASAEDQVEVNELRRQRMHAILQRRRNAKAAADAGYGCLRDVSSTKAQVLHSTRQHVTS